MASAAILSAQWRRHGNYQFEEGLGADKPVPGWSGSSGNEVMLQPQAQQGEVPAGGTPVESLIPTLALSTLPAFQRAQQLLREMAGLAFRLTELAGNKIWAGGHNKAGVQFLPGATIPPQGLAAGTTREVLAVMEAHQALLLSAVGELQQLQQIEAEQQRVANGLAAHSGSMRTLARGLRTAHQVLEAGLERHQEHRAPQKRRRTGLDGLGSGTVDVADLVAYAHRISYTTFAPPEFADGQTPLRNALPPAPQEEQMRASQLYLFSDMDVGLPKPPPPLPKTSGLLDAIKMELPGLGLAAPPPMPPPGWKPGMPVDIPPGWKPGMPVDIPLGWKPGMPVSFPEGLDFINVPHGWKPGDAVVLPPEVHVPQRAALPPPSEILLKARDLPAPPPPEHGTIQVDHVQLDLNPELEDDDYGSEYGSEDAASSDEDDDDE